MKGHLFKMKTLFVHIGTPKTATTSIQYFCQENNAVLGENNFYYPDFSSLYKGINPFRNGHFLCARQLNAEGKPDILEEKKVFRSCMDHIIYMFSKFDNILISDEGLWYASHFQKRDFWGALKKEAKQNEFAIKIIVYLRRQDKFVSSMWNQKIKKGSTRFSTMTWEEFINADKPAFFLDYYEGLEKISSYFGKENITVRRFETKHLKNSSIYEDFLDTLGLSLNSRYVISSSERNLRLTGNANEIKRILNGVPVSAPTDYTFFRHLLADLSDANPDESKLEMFSPEEAENFVRQYSESNQMVMEHYLHQSGNLFSTNFGKADKWTWDNHNMNEDLIRFLGLSLSSLREENRKLRARLTQLEAQQTEQNKAITELKSQLKHPIRTIVNHFKN